MSTYSPAQVSQSLYNIRYEIRGPLAQRAHELEKKGYDILSLNIGNPGLFGFKAPETMRVALIEHLEHCEAYCHQKGIFSAREAIVAQQQARGVTNINPDHVVMGNGVSELIDLSLRALLNPGDEILIPSPDYPLWTAATTLNGGKVIYYPCSKDHSFLPDLNAIKDLISKKTKAIVIINPNNPTGVVYPKETLQEMISLARENNLVVLSDEIYDQMLYPNCIFTPIATLAPDLVCVTFNGLSKAYRACGYRVGWAVVTGPMKYAKSLLQNMDLLAALRLCSNVPGQWTVQAALNGHQCIRALCSPKGRLFESRAAITQAVTKSPYLNYVEPAGSMYAFIGVDTHAIPHFSDTQFALQLLEEEHVLIAPGSSFNTPYQNHFRITLLPEASVLQTAFIKINNQLKKIEQKN